jgi:hypothetical protein
VRVLCGGEHYGSKLKGNIRVADASRR